MLPKAGAGAGPLRRARLVGGILARGQQRARQGLRAHCELGESLAQRLGLPAGAMIFLLG